MVAEACAASSKEELGELFRARVDSMLFGVDTFWYGADFAGDTLEYLVIVKLPYGVPDRFTTRSAPRSGRASSAAASTCRARWRSSGRASAA
jgi:ATP-dependent DNA helicase DinG